MRRRGLVVAEVVVEVGQRFVVWMLRLSLKRRVWVFVLIWAISVHPWYHFAFDRRPNLGLRGAGDGRRSGLGFVLAEDVLVENGQCLVLRIVYWLLKIFAASCTLVPSRDNPVLECWLKCFF